MMKTAEIISHAEKWRRIGKLDARLKALDAEWERLVQEKNELLLVRVRPLPTGRCMRRTAEAAQRLAGKIHALRDQGMTQRAIAEELGVSRDMVARYLSPGNKAAIRAGVCA